MSPGTRLRGSRPAEHLLEWRLRELPYEQVPATHGITTLRLYTGRIQEASFRCSLSAITVVENSNYIHTRTNIKYWYVYHMGRRSSFSGYARATRFVWCPIANGEPICFNGILFETIYRSISARTNYGTLTVALWPDSLVCAGSRRHEMVAKPTETNDVGVS